MRIVECQSQLVELGLIDFKHLLDGFLAVVLLHRVRLGIGQLAHVVASRSRVLPCELALFLRTGFACTPTCRTHDRLPMRGFYPSPDVASKRRSQFSDAVLRRDVNLDASPLESVKGRRPVGTAR